jgi:hypothetical protein
MLIRGWASALRGRGPPGCQWLHRDTQARRDSNPPCTGAQLGLSLLDASAENKSGKWHICSIMATGGTEALAARAAPRLPAKLEVQVHRPTALCPAARRYHEGGCIIHIMRRLSWRLGNVGNMQT